MKFSEYRQHDATALAELVRNGDVTPTELLTTAHKRMAEVNPEINAVILDLFADTKAQLAEGPPPEGSFAGVPFLLKDMDGALAGYPCNMGSRSLEHYIPTQDATLIARYRAAGLQFLGKTNCPEFGIMAISEPELHGPTRNPWDLDRTPGGSSGGSAAAVAAGIVPAAHAGDGGGSIRIPASHCGLFGIKPSRGRMPLGPDINEGWQGFVVPHAVTRSVRDSAALLQATHGADQGAPYAEPGGNRQFVKALARASRRLKIAYSTKALLAENNSDEAVAAVQNAVKLLADLGHRVTELDLELDVPEITTTYLTAVAAGVSRAVANTERMTGRPPTSSEFEQATWFLAQVGEALSAADLQGARDTMLALTRRLAGDLADYDMFVSSTVSAPPSEIGELALGTVQKIGLDAIGAAKKVAGPLVDPVFRAALADLAADSLTRVPQTQVFNLTGRPAMSVPLHWSAEGHPLGVQFVGHLGTESLMFQLAHQLEQAQPWFDRVPPLP